MAGNKFVLNIWQEAKQDIANLDGAQLVFVRKGLRRIQKYGDQCGQPLSGKLAGYRKLKNKKMGLRIVFGKNPQNNEIEIIDIIAIGQRRRLAVYQNAQSRIDKHK